MWLLSTDHAELSFFASPEQVPGGYAILSHVWDDEELSFHDLHILCAECLLTGANPRDRVPRKIRMACILAEQHGYNWLWVDTCCIDKTSSAELSESINSMFRYYALAGVCYAYLRDVPADTLMEESSFGTAFWEAIWHKRGWTLQELLAPKLVIFVAANWTVLGTKAEHAVLLQKITRIPVSVLRFEQDVADVSVAMRMSWAARRRTTRPEDEAYCLMGLFGVSMTTLYGEGRKAFYRLQEEIMRSSIDPSLFLWGRVATFEDLRYRARASSEEHHDHYSNDSYLLAPAPESFQWIDGDVKFDPPQRPQGKRTSAVWKLLAGITASNRTSVPTFNITPYGVEVHAAVLELSTCLLVILSCSDEHGPTGLALSRCPDGTDPQRPLYHCSFHGARRISQLLRDGTRRLPRTSWRTLYITHQPPFRADTDPAPLPIRYMNTTISSPFRIDLTPPAPSRNPTHAQAVLNSTLSLSPIPFGWTGSPPLTLKVYEGYFMPSKTSKPRIYCIYVTLGICTNTQRRSRAPPSPSSISSSTSSGPSTAPAFRVSSPSEPAIGPHWAAVSMRFYDDRSQIPEHPPAAPHTCPTDHIALWPGMAKSFAVELAPDRDRSSGYSFAGARDGLDEEARRRMSAAVRGAMIMDFKLGFAPCPLNASGRTLMMKYPVLETYY